MPDFDLVSFFAEYAYQPYLVYTFIVLFMTASSFGLPIPEEMTLVSAGLVAYMAQDPVRFPPPTPDSEGVNLVLLCVICFIAVLASDILIYTIGRVFGQKIVRTSFFQKRFGSDRFDKINTIYQKYSYWACGLFRFTPGIRFPGHLSCGLMGISIWKFILVDGFAALISVPTQVYLVATYGDIILDKIKEFKLILLAVVGVVLIVWLFKKGITSLRKRQAS